MEEGDVRVLSARLNNLIEAAKILGKPIDPHLLYRAKRSIVMWHEHTWGAWCSISDPDAHFTKDQWRVKKAFADSAGWYVKRIEEGLGIEKDSRIIDPSATFRTGSDTSTARFSFARALTLVPHDEWRRIAFDPASAENASAENPWHRLSSDWPVPRPSYTLTGTDSIEVRTIGADDFWRISSTIHKRSDRDKESLHLALPFKIPNATVRIGIGDTCVTPESGRIPGSNNDFFCAQRWIDVSNDSMGVTIVCPQGAIWEVGEMVDERKVNPGRGTNPEKYKAWKTEAKSSSTIYLYALNNYWHTNFKADQEGPITFDVYLKMHGPFKLEEARRFGLEMTRPLITWWK
jgi:hypothetical protein